MKLRKLESESDRFEKMIANMKFPAKHRVLSKVKQSKHLKGQLDPPVSDEKCVSRKMSIFLKGCLLLLLLPNDPV